MSTHTTTGLFGESSMHLHENKLTELQQRIVAIDASIAKLDGDFAELAYAFDVGDQAALKKASAIELQVDQLRRERALVTAKQKHIAEQQQDEQAAAEQQVEQQKQVEAKQHAGAIAALNSDLDRLLTELRDQFERRHALLTQLGRTGVVDFNLVNRLTGKQNGTRAACHAGLAKFLALEVPAPGSFIPLAGANQILLGVGKEHAQRPRLNGGGGNS